MNQNLTTTFRGVTDGEAVRLEVNLGDNLISLGVLENGRGHRIKFTPEELRKLIAFLDGLTKD